MTTFRLRIGFGFLIFLAFFMACQRNILESQSNRQIRLSFKQVDRPSQPTLFDATLPAKLSKTTRLVTDQVVFLQCNEDSGRQALDAGKYGNNAYLFNVRRIDSSATPTLKKALDFQTNVSYATLENVGELDATHGFNIEFYFYLKDPYTEREQHMLDRLDFNGGYAIGIVNGHVFLRVKQSGKLLEARGGSTLTTRRWYKLQAFFGSGKIGLNLDGKTEAEVTIDGTLTPSAWQTLLGSGWGESAFISFPFWGRMDEISITTTVEYEDFDAIRVMVFDLNKFASSDSFYRSHDWYAYQQTSHLVFEDTTKIPTWETWKNIWTEYFDIASESALTVQNGFAQGTIRGVEGLNMIAIGAIQKNRITFFGFGFAAVVDGRQITDAEMEIWKPGGDF